MIETKGLSYAYPNSAQILNEIRFSAEPGHFLALLGNNGAGKSTLLKCLNGILPVGIVRRVVRHCDYPSSCILIALRISAFHPL